ncbi:MAG: TonB-dependent receptor [Vicinamibacterales bacterium]
MALPRLCTALLAAVLLVLSGVPVSGAQYNAADLSGRVTDASGLPLPAALVVAVHTLTGLRTERRSDADGRFVLPGLLAGDYLVSCEQAGFRRTERALTLEAGQHADIAFRLALGEFTESIQVTGDAPLLRASTAEVAEVIGQRQLRDLPVNGRLVIQLAQLTDGVALPPGGTRGAALGQVGPLPAVYGQRGGHNIYLLDGVKVTDEYFNNLVISPSLDAVQDVKVQKTMYPAEFGGKASALINVVTASGGNRVRGTASAFLRDARFDAHNRFDDRSRPVPASNQQQFGMTVGGPLRTNRAFFFASVEGQRTRKALTQAFSVPAAALRGGDFSSISTALCDPLTRRVDGTCRAFAGNVLPADRLDPVARLLLARVPAPTAERAVQNLVATGESRSPSTQFSLRLDDAPGPNERLYARLTTFRVRETQPFGTSALNEALVPGFGRILTTRSENAALGYTHTFSPRLLNELRAGYLHAAGGQESVNRGVDFALLSGLQGVTSDPRDMGYPQVTFGGLFSPIGDPPSFVARDNRSVEVYENLLVEKTRHRVKMGAYLFSLWFNPENPQNARGTFSFTGQWTGNAFADFLLGYPATAQVGIGRADERGRSTWLHAYAQDEWRASDALTVSYGLRYELNGQMTDVGNRLSAVDLERRRFVIASDRAGTIAAAPDLLAQIPIPYVTSADAGWTRGLLRPSYRRFAPRLGVVWMPGDSQRTVVNAGAGVFLNQWAYSVQQALAQTLPFFFAKTVAAAGDALVPAAETRSALLGPATGTIGGNTMLWDFRTEYAKNYSASVQQQIGDHTVVELSVLRSAIVGADSSTVLNVPEPGPGPIAGRRPVPELSSITAIRWDGYSRFNSATARAQRRMAGGLAGSVAYTLSRAVDDASDPGPTTNEVNLPQNVRDMTAEHAVASFDHRHRVVASASWDVPALPRGGWLTTLTRGWRVSGVALLESGAPFTVNIATDRANIGPGPAQRPDQVCDPNRGGGRTVDQWFNTACFALQPQFAFGSAPRNSVRAPGYGSVDVALQRSVTVRGGGRLQMRWEVYNLLDRTNLDVPNRIAFSPQFGRIFSARPARQMQFGLRLEF